MSSLLVDRKCHFSKDRAYRYSLEITWNPELKPQMFVGLNPSTADEEKDDATVRRCIDFAQAWGAGGLVMTNAFAFRATDPKVMMKHYEPIGRENTLAYLSSVAMRCLNRPIACWGTMANFQPAIRRGDYLKRFMGKLDCLQVTKDGHPSHPLYLKSDLVPIPFNYTVEG
jgi:hypothetical protein